MLLFRYEVYELLFFKNMRECSMYWIPLTRDKSLKIKPIKTDEPMELKRKEKNKMVFQC